MQFVTYGKLMVLNKEPNFDGVGKFGGVARDSSHGCLPVSPCRLSLVWADSA